MLISIIIFVAVLGVLVFVHELGHFGVAKIFKVGVEEFGFGWPPRMFGVKKGETLYSLNWIPIGGFCKIKGIVGGEEGSGEKGYEKDKDSFLNRPVWQRFSIILAGVIMNFLLAAILFSVGFMIGMPSSLENLPASATVENKSVAILELLPDSPAQTAELQVGDKILKVEDKSIASVAEFKELIAKQNDGKVNLLIERDNEEIEKTVEPKQIAEINQPGIGVALTETGLVSLPWYQAIYRGFSYTVRLTILITQALWNILIGLFTHEASSMAQFSGPVGIAVMTNQMAQMGFIYLLQFTALISINLAIFNLLPLPALDGGRLIFLIIEKIKGKPVNQNIEIIVHNLGFYFLLLLLIIVTFKDFAKFEIFNYIKNIFV